MKSKPVYEPLELDPTARRHILFAGGERAGTSFPALAGLERIILGDLAGEAAIEEAVDSALLRSGLETAFYIAGPERFLWNVARRLCAAGVPESRIRLELAGSASRRVYCVHCRTINDLVTDTVHTCRGCGILLAVRDHFSRPLGAYMGVVANAETPQEIPASETVYT